jgi:hypothetical protein
LKSVTIQKCGYTGTRANNGNVQPETIKVYSDAGVLAAMAQQVFGYNGYNRLETFQEGSLTETNCFDERGNRAVLAAPGLSPRILRFVNVLMGGLLGASSIMAAECKLAGK